MNRKNRNLIMTIFISGLGVAIGYLINFLITPYITTHIGIDAYGFVSIAKTTVSYAGIFTIAFTAFIVRYISVSYHKREMNEAREYYSSSIVACLFISFVIFVVACFSIYKLEMFLKIPSHLMKSVKILFVLVFMNFIITTITTPFGTAAYIKNRLDITGVIKIIAYICEAIVMMILFTIFEPDVWFVGLGSFVASCITLLLYWVITRRLTPELFFNRKYVFIKRIKNLASHGIWNSLNSLGNVLNSGLDLIVSNMMLSGVETGQIAVAKSIGTMFATLFQVLIQPFQPQMLKSYASGSIDDFLSDLKRAMNVCGYFANVVFAGFLALGKLYFKLWLPSENASLLHTLTLLTVIIYVTDGVLRPVYYINTLTTKNKLPCVITIAGGFMNIIGMFILLKYTKLGVYAVVLTTAVIMIAINLFFNPIYAARCLKISQAIIYKTLFRNLISCMTLCLIFTFIAYIFNPSTWIDLMLDAIIMVFIGVLVHDEIVDDNKIVFNAIKKIFRKGF